MLSIIQGGRKRPIPSHPETEAGDFFAPEYEQMAFDPLETDEATPGGKAPGDMDKAMLAGCTSFVFNSFLAYGLGVWPFFAMPDTWRTSVLLTSIAAGLTPVLILCLIVSRKLGLPGATGVVAGSMAMAVFLYLRFDQVMMGFVIREIPNPEYPTAFGWIIPIGWFLAVVATAVLFTKNEPAENAG